MGSILAAPERFDFLGEQDLSGRLGLIKAIHGHLQANEAVLADESPGDLRRPGDTSRPFKFKNSELLSQTLFWAALWPLDLDRLQTIHDRLRDDQRGFPRIFFLSLGVLHEFVWWFTRDPKEARQFQVARKDAQRRKTYIRDGGVCCITGRDAAEGCHIIPFWTLTRPDRSYLLVNRLKGLLGPEFAGRLEEILMSDIDTPANILFLSRQLHRYWAMGIFALEPLGYDSRLKESADDTLLFDAPLKTPTAEPLTTTPLSTVTSGVATPSTPISGPATSVPATMGPVTSSRVSSVESLKRRLESQGENESNKMVPPAEGKEKATLEYCIKLRFHWLPKTSISSLRAPLTAGILNNSPRPLFVEFDKIQDEFQAACGREIDTGEIITIWADKREDLPAMEILKLQWLAYLMHRLAGGADPHVYEPPLPDSDDLGQLEMLQRDHTELQRLQKRMADLKIREKLQKLWDQGVFALQPLGYDSRPKEREAGASVEHLEKEDLEHCLKLRFQWLPKTSVQNLRETASPDLLNTSPRDLIQEFEMNEELQADMGRRINSGETITIWADRREDVPAIGFLRVRWLACLIHRFTGGADPKVYEPPFPDSDDIYAIGSMLRDAAELSRLRKRLADLELRIKNRMADA
ncbi:hypothetical protein K4K58_000129 [Colletotrichum sp. SAR11_239]|nr:hypothetical protein K4K58_000129 [Colletotrichum sp. SAR11_239]